MIILLLLLLIVCAELCLAEPTVELNVHVVVLRSPEPNLCEDTDFWNTIEEAALTYYQPPDFEEEDISCGMQGFTRVSCRMHGKPRKYLRIGTV